MMRVGKVMKRHVFKVIHQGWDKTAEGIWFDADDYTEEEAKAQFQEVQKESFKNDHWVTYTAYDYQGELFYDVQYLGVFDEDNMPGM